ncbi:hypothetical protein EPN83_03000 [Patescibacteria group bacterium]|nr:MAG: hypothetical protein EPN83_03000 [Patescibacteria group bacterium]
MSEEKLLEPEAESEVQEERRIYEIGYLVFPTVAEGDVPAVAAEIKKAIEKHSGVFVSEGFPSLRTLAYAMTKPMGTGRQKFTSAYFGWVKFENYPSAIGELEQELEKNENLIRFLAVRAARENTFTAARPAFSKEPPAEARSASKKPERAGKINEAEIDRSIEELVAE